MNTRQTFLFVGTCAITQLSLGQGIVPQPCPITLGMTLGSRAVANNLRAGVSWDYVKSLYYTQFDACTTFDLGSHCFITYQEQCDTAMGDWRSVVRNAFRQDVLDAAPTCRGDYYFTGQPSDSYDQWCFGSTDLQYPTSLSQTVYLCFKQFGTPAHPASFRWIVNHASSTSVSTVYMDPRDNWLNGCTEWYDPYHYHYANSGPSCPGWGDGVWNVSEVESRATARAFTGVINKPMWLVNNNPGSGPVRIGGGV